jgi:hypothetical protein
LEFRNWVMENRIDDANDANDPMNEDDEDGRWKSALIELIFDKALCSSLQESQAIVESIAEEREDNRNGDSPGMETEITEWTHALQDFLGISVEESHQIIDQCRAAISTSKGDAETHEDSEEESLLESGSDDEDDDGEYLEPGECELCERCMRLTRHHLIPKSTWQRMEVKMQHDWQAWCQQGSTSEDRAETPAGCSGWMQQLIAQESLDSARFSSKADRRQQQQDLHSKTIRAMFKHHTCSICRPCHSAIHRFHDNMTLAQQYNTTELLLQDQQVYKFCQWASKQRAGKYKHAVT